MNWMLRRLSNKFQVIGLFNALMGNGINRSASISPFVNHCARRHLVPDFHRKNSLLRERWIFFCRVNLHARSEQIFVRRAFRLVMQASGNRAMQLLNPAKRLIIQKKKWSERRDLNPRRSPWQGDALPTELRSRPKVLK